MSDTVDTKPFELTLPALIVAPTYREGAEFIAVRGLHPSMPGVALVSLSSSPYVDGEAAVVRAMQGRRGTTCYVVGAWFGDRLSQLATAYGLDVVQVVS